MPLPSLPSTSCLAKAAGAAVAVGAVVKILKAVKASKARAALRALEPNIVHLFAFPRWKEGPNFSSPCLKLETFLRIAKIPYVVHFTMDSETLSPTGRLPFIAYNGTVLADSHFIMEFLTRQFNVRIDAALTPEQRAVGLAVRRQTETFVSWGMYRSLTVDNPDVLADLLVKNMGAPRLLVKCAIIPPWRKRTIQMLNMCGHGDLTDEQYRAEFLSDLKGLETLLSKQQFLLTNDWPTSYDCSVYNYLSILTQISLNTDELLYVKKSAVIQAYLNRMHALAFPDMKEITADTKVPRQRFDKI